MANASGISTQLAYIPEVTRGVTPTTPTLTLLRPTSRNVNPAKDIMESNEVDVSGLDIDARHGFTRVEGQFGGEMLTDVWNDWIAAGVGGDWSSTLSMSVATGITAPATITRATGSFVTDGVKVGDTITNSGFASANNNGRFMVVSVSALSMTVAVSADFPLVTVSAGAAITVLAGKRVNLGLGMKTFTMERRQPDISVYDPFLGVTSNTLAVSVQPGQIPTLTWTVLGLKPLVASTSSISTGGGGVLTAAPTGYPYSSFDGQVTLNGAVSGVVTGIDLNINLQRSLLPVVGAKFSPDIFEGKRMVTGNITILFQSVAVYNYYMNETPIPIGLEFNDPDGTNWQSIYMPRCKLLGAPKDPAQTGPILVPCPFRAFKDQTSGQQLSWMRSTTT